MRLEKNPNKPKPQNSLGKCFSLSWEFGYPFWMLTAVFNKLNKKESQLRTTFSCKQNKTNKTNQYKKWKCTELSTKNLAQAEKDFPLQPQMWASFLQAEHTDKQLKELQLSIAYCNCNTLMRIWCNSPSLAVNSMSQAQCMMVFLLQSASYYPV